MVTAFTGLNILLLHVFVDPFARRSVDSISDEFVGIFDGTAADETHETSTSRNATLDNSVNNSLTLSQTSTTSLTSMTSIGEKQRADLTNLSLNFEDDMWDMGIKYIIIKIRSLLNMNTI